MARTKKVNEMMTNGLGTMGIWDLGHGPGNNYQGQAILASGGAGAANSSFLKRYQDVSAMADRLSLWFVNTAGDMQVTTGAHSNISFNDYIGPTAGNILVPPVNNNQAPNFFQQGSGVGDATNNTYIYDAANAGSVFGHAFADHTNYFVLQTFLFVTGPNELRMG